jgi:hypothetical protein
LDDEIAGDVVEGVKNKGEGGEDGGFYYVRRRVV